MRTSSIPVIDDGKFIYAGVSRSMQSVNVKRKVRRTVTRNFDWDALYQKCRLYQDFIDGSSYYYYPQLFHIATNLINIEKGKRMFLKILNAPENSACTAYHTCSWDVILNILIAMNYQPQGCCNCPYEKECLHAKNMILTAKPGKSTILQTVKKEYVSIQEAEEDLKNKFLQAVSSEKPGVHIIKAQTGIGKTNLYLNYLLKNPNETFLIAAPTHKLKMEVYNNAIRKGIRNIAYTPEMPEFSPEIQEKINRIYAVGAGKHALHMMSEICNNLPDGHHDKRAFQEYCSTLENVEEYDGHGYHNT